MTLPQQAAFEVLLWPDGAPTVVRDARPERWFTSPPDAPFHYRQVRNVTEPSLTAFLPEPESATGTAVIICPGGAHHTLAIDHEGNDVARWLATRGVAAFVLKNRVLPTPDDDDAFELHMRDLMSNTATLVPRIQAHLPHLLADGQRAVQLVREHAAKWGIAPDRVGMLGFSAGGHLAVLTALQADGAGPDFLAPIYGSMWGDVTAPPSAPPLFLAYANDDELGYLVIGANWTLYDAWRAAGRPVELHAYTRGGHGFGLHAQGLPSDHWTEQFYAWLQAEGLLAGR
ncbi:acetyl esterase/lipase [Deinococcus metalli]|uniref:Acetyl esterase/lipase n=1 Tax=Deinococcus metalli TaxID=1141878 RepID=A0A7W8KE53_9DEIO|nr:alpha/beta hydrolase [Deinococcus metalli]MBB5376517.1 acetyl esterase/lipase [Deinococcus metalli]GHF43435.1 xylanase [Deinococcus metalli]